MAPKYILVETEEKRKTLHAALGDEGEVIVVPSIAAVVEVKNVDHLSRGTEGFFFKPVSGCHDVLKRVLQSGQENVYLAFDRSELGEYSSWLWAGVAGQLYKGVLHCHRLHLASLDKKGLTNLDRSVLKTIIDFYQGGPVGIEALSATLQEEADTLVDVVEPYLLKTGLLIRTSSGRKVSEAAYTHLGYPPPR